MALGGGTYTAQNRVLPGTYINFVSAKSTASVGSRGVAALALPLTWGPDGCIFEVTEEDFRKNSLRLLGFGCEEEAAKGLRDLFRNISTLYCWKLMKDGKYASNSIARAKYKGSTGAKLSTEITESASAGTFDVTIRLATRIVYSASVSSLEELTAVDNGWVVWTLDALAASPFTPFDGTGLDGGEITVAEYSDFLDAAESYSFNALGCISTQKEVRDLFVQEVKDMRENAGIKYQAVLHNAPADYEGVVNVKNSVEAVYWTLGVIAGCPLHESNTNRTYDGEFDIPVNYTQAQLEAGLQAGEFIFHRVGREIRVLEDINSLVTVTEEKNRDFSSNQTIRVIDQIAMDIAAIFNDRYSGKIPNDAAGRVSLWNDIVSHHKALAAQRAIEEFETANVTVEEGDSKKSVVVTDVIRTINAMSQLYMTVVVA